MSGVDGLIVAVILAVVLVELICTSLGKGRPKSRAAKLSRMNRGSGQGDDKSTSYHEAGHARAIAKAGVKVELMELRAGGGGGTKFKDQDLTPRQHKAMLLAIIAGQESECQYLMSARGMSYRQALAATHHGASGDRAIFEEMAAGTGHTWAGLQGEARRFVKRNAYTIETNAKPLHRRGRRGGTWA